MKTSDVRGKGCSGLGDQAFEELSFFPEFLERIFLGKEAIYKGTEAETSPGSL